MKMLMKIQSVLLVTMRPAAPIIRFATAAIAGVMLIGGASRTASAATVNFQVDLSTQAGSYSGTQSPGHQVGWPVLPFFNSSQTVWNAAAGDANNLSYYSDNVLVTGATGVQLDMGQARVDGAGANTLSESTGMVGWQYGANTFAQTTTGFYHTALMEDILYSSNVQVAARVRGLPAGSYRVFSLDAFSGDLSRTYDVSFGVNIERPGDALSTQTVGPGTGLSSWVASPGNPSNYAYQDLTISGPTDWITIIVRGALSPAINGIQIATLPEPAGAGIVLSMAGLLLGRRRRIACNLGN